MPGRIPFIWQAPVQEMYLSDGVTGITDPHTHCFGTWVKGPTRCPAAAVGSQTKSGESTIMGEESLGSRQVSSSTWLLTTLPLNILQQFTKTRLKSTESEGCRSS